MLRDTRASAVGGRILERGHLDEIEVIKKADPHYTGQQMHPSC